MTTPTGITRDLLITRDGTVPQQEGTAMTDPRIPLRDVPEGAAEAAVEIAHHLHHQDWNAAAQVESGWASSPYGAIDIEPLVTVLSDLFASHDHAHRSPR